MTKTFGAAEFKATCLRVINQMNQDREPVVVTRHGQPVAILSPMVPDPERPLVVGAMRGCPPLRRSVRASCGPSGLVAALTVLDTRALVATLAKAATLAALVSAALACTLPDAHQQAAEQPGWPTQAWPTSTPEAEGIDPAAVDSLLADIDAGRYGLIDHFLLIRHGRVVADRHWDHGPRYAELLAAQDDTANHQYNYDHPAWHPFYRDTPLHSLQSVTKSVVSVAFGIAVDEGHMPGVESPAWSWFEAYEPDMTDPRRAAATLEDFLTMRSGIAWATPGQTYDDPEHPTVVLEASDEWIAYATSRPMAEDPGTRFDYNDGVSVLLGKIVREATGMRMDAWAAERLFRPIGIDEHYWKITPDGEADTEGGLYLAPHDLARIGYLMLRNGQWDGRQIVSEAWVRASTSPIVPDVAPNNDRADTGYGYQWWVPVHAEGESAVFAANGYGGQFLHVSPEHDLISVFNGWTLHEQPELSSWTAFQERILPAVR